MIRRANDSNRMMKWASWAVCLIVVCALGTAGADVFVQEPPDVDPEDSNGDGDPFNDHVYWHLTAGDGFVNMADGYLQYMFGFSDATGTYDNSVMVDKMLAAEFPSPTIVVNEGEKLFLTLTNVGMAMILSSSANCGFLRISITSSS